MNDANFSHDFLKNSIFDQVNRRKRKFSKNDDFNEKIFISSFRKFKQQIISWYFLNQLSHNWFNVQIKNIKIQSLKFLSKISKHLTNTNVENIIVAFIDNQKSSTRFKKSFTKSQISKNLKNSQRKIETFENETINFETQTQNIAQKKMINFNQHSQHC